MRILFCMEDLCFGGTQRQTLELALRLDRSRFEPSFLVLTGKTDLDSVLEDIPVTYIGSTRSVHPFFFLLLGRFIRKLKPDLLVPCTALPNIWVRIWGKILGIPVLGTCRGGGGPLRQHERFLWRFTCHLVCNTQALRLHLESLGVPKQHISVIQNGIDASLYTPESDISLRPPSLLCVARLAKDKDHETLLRAFSLVLERFPNATLHIVGDGPRQKALFSWIPKYPRESLFFHPGTDTVIPFYQKARIFVLSSVREGQPNVLLEAMSSALPICATEVGGIPAMLTHGVTALLSKAGDERALANNICTLLADPAQATALGLAAQKEAQSRFSFSTMVAAHEALFSVFGKKNP